jgi:hypothetical protein
MTLYATLADAKGEMQASTTLGDAKLLNNLRIVSRRVDRLFQSRRPYFAPWIESHEIALNPNRVNSRERTFKLNRPLLALTSVTVGTEALTLATQVKAWMPLDTPIRKLILVDGGDAWYSYCDDNEDPRRVIVAGTWGYNRDWANAWLSVTTLGAAITTTTATAITVTDIDGTDAYGRSPWISAGALLKIDDEYLEVTATNTSTNVATVRRGVNGSTAATHLNAATVSVYQVEEDLRQVVARQAGFMYARQGAYVTTQITDIGAVTYPPDLLPELRNTIAGYAYE